jgi:hypothetical protein
MDLRLSCPLRVATVPWQSEPGRHALCVICKATYRLEPGVARLEPVQLAPTRNDRYWNEAPSRSLYAPSDLAPAKPRADVLLVGRAFSPESSPVPSIRTRLCVGGIDKRLEVFGARSFAPDGKLVQESKILDLSLWYERAAGGPGTSNPVGVGVDARDGRGWRLLPSIQPAAWRVARPDDPIPPAGYGPIAPSWPTRQSKLRAHAGTFEPTTWWDEPLPADFDLAYFNTAPEDQQLHELRPDAAIVLENLMSKHPRLATRLPGLRPRAMLKRRRGQRERVSMKADTLWIDSARGICTLTWRGRVDLQQLDEPGRIEIVMEQERENGVVLVVAGSAEAEPDAQGTRRLRTGPNDDPDGGVTEPTCPEMVLPAKPGASRPRRRRPEPDEYTPVATPLPGTVASDPLPFRRSMPSTGNTPPAMLQDAALPFRKSVPPPLPSRPALPHQGHSDPPAPLQFVHAPTATASRPPVAPPRPSSPWAMGAPSAERRSRPPGPMPSPLASNPGEPPKPPPMMGPLSTPEMLAAAPDPKSEPAADASHEPVPAAEAEHKPAPAAEAEHKPAADAEHKPAPAAEAEHKPAPETVTKEPPAAADRISVEQCAAIAASLALRPDHAATILKDHELAAEPWKAIEAYWAEQIRSETNLGRARLLRSYDRTYVERLEEERGPIQVDEYARLVVAAERGHAESVLRELRLPAGATVRIERVFLRRVVDRPALGEKVRRAVEAARSR